MAVTTEPPWVNKSSGNFAREAGTSHVIPFGFTSTTGNFLVFVVFGAVTHTVTGWTERLQPVNSGELSVFTKTSAGESSITDVNNGANYPLGWVCYEFPAGTSYTTGAGTSTTRTASQSQTLSGLPGTAQVVIAAKGVGLSAAGSTTYTWTTSGAVEDFDGTVAPSPTDGYSFSVAHLINVTGTSQAMASTQSSDVGAPDTQLVIFALDAAAVSSGTTGTSAITLPALTQAAEGTHTPPPTTGTSAQTLPAMTQSATGTHTPPNFTGTSALTLGALTQTAAGAHTPPDFTGTSAQTLEALTQIAAGTSTVPDFTGTSALTLGTLTQAADGSTVAPDFTGAGASVLTTLAQSAEGTVIAPAGSITTLLGELTQIAAGTVTVPAFTGVAVSGLPSANASANGTVTDPVPGVIASVLPTLAQAGTGTFIALVEGLAESLLQELLSVATGTNIPPVFAGSATSALPAIEQALDGYFSAGPFPTVQETRTLETSSPTTSLVAQTPVRTLTSSQPIFTLGVET